MPSAFLVENVTRSHKMLHFVLCSAWQLGMSVGRSISIFHHYQVRFALWDVIPYSTLYTPVRGFMQKAAQKWRQFIWRRVKFWQIMTLGDNSDQTQMMIRFFGVIFLCLLYGLQIMIVIFVQSL